MGAMAVEAVPLFRKISHGGRQLDGRGLGFRAYNDTLYYKRL